MASIEELGRDIITELKEHSRLLRSIDTRMELNQNMIQNLIKERNEESDEIIKSAFPGMSKEEIAKQMFEMAKQGTESMVQALGHINRDKDSFKPFVKPRIDWSKEQEKEQEQEQQEDESMADNH